MIIVDFMPICTAPIITAQFSNVLGKASPFPTDLIIQVKGGKAFNCHKCILQKRASYFKGLVGVQG